MSAQADADSCEGCASNSDDNFCQTNGERTTKGHVDNVYPQGSAVLTATAAAAIFERFQAEEHAREELDDESEDSSDEEFEIVISLDPVKSTEARSPTTTAENFSGNSDTRSRAEAAPEVCEPDKNNRKTQESQKKPVSEDGIAANGKQVRQKAAGKKKKQKQKQSSGPKLSLEEVEAAKKLKAQQKIELKEKGYITGKHDAPLQPETYEYKSDELLAEDDPYLSKGCERRTVFVSDIVPEQYRFANFEGRNKDRPPIRNAIDKFFNWCESRPTSARRGRQDWDEEGYNDGRKARHFVLKMGPPNGPLGHPTTLASRLKSIWSHFLIKRLRSSHVTIETEIPFHKLAGTDYFKAYMDQISDMMGPKKLGGRLSIILTAAPTDSLYNADPATFYAEPIDVDRQWDQAQLDKDNFERHVLSLVDPGYRFKLQANPDHWEPLTREQFDNAEVIFRRQKAAEMLNQRLTVNTALAEVKTFIDGVRKFEQAKMPARAPVPASTTIDTAGESVPTAQSPQHVPAARSGFLSASNTRPHVSPQQPPVHTVQHSQHSVQPYDFLRELPRSSRYTPAGWYGPHPDHSPSISGSYGQQRPPPQYQMHSAIRYIAHPQPSAGQQHTHQDSHPQFQYPHVSAEHQQHPHSIAASQKTWAQPSSPSPVAGAVESGAPAAFSASYLSNGVSKMSHATMTPTMSSVTHTPPAPAVHEKRKRGNDDEERGADTLKRGKTGNGV